MERIQASPKITKGRYKMSEALKKRALSPNEVEAIYGIPQGSLANMRWKKTGPKYYKVGTKRVKYLVDDVEDWMTKAPVLTKDSMEGKKWN
jgi:hypothetical protein